MKKIVYILISLILLFVSCNADILTSDIDRIDTETDSNNTMTVFTGDAPKNVWASQSYYTDRIVISFDGVNGADYYNIHRAVVPRSETNIDFDSLTWERIPYQIPSESGSIRYTYTDYNIDSDKKDSYMYCYSITAGSYFVDSRGGIDSEYSDVVEGWTLAPPVSLSATQGDDDEFIELRWSQVGMVSGYDLYYSLDSNAAEETWIKANRTRIPGTLNSEISYRFDPVKDFNDKTLLGKDIYFRVVSYSRADAPSERSGMRVGYTFMEGAPTKPANVTVSNGDYPSKIAISWDKPMKEDQVEGGYIWEVSRSTATTDSVQILTFATSDVDSNKLPNGMTYADGRYTYIDSSKDLDPNEEYIYSIRAKCYIENPEDPSTTILVPGQAAEKTGYLLAPSQSITEKITNYPTSSFNGSFEFTIAEAPKGYEDGKDFDYVIYGRNNVDDVVSSWRELTTKKVTGSPCHLTISYDPENPVNEFSYAIRNNKLQEENESKRYDEIYGNAIVTELAPAPSIDNLNMLNNTYRSDLVANSNGVYPVIVNCSTSDVYSSYKIEVVETDSPNNNSTVAGTKFLASGEDIALDANLSPATAGVKWSYRIAGKDAFGRYSEYSSYKLGYGALTGHAYVKFFEAYGLKPWEFLSHDDFPQNLKNKWSSSQIYAKVSAEATKADITEYSNYHNGSIHYTVNANLATFQGDIRFTYSNFGEHPDFKIVTGMYQMSVGLSGTGSISANEPFVIEGMYPGTIIISSQYMEVSSKKFKGNYSVTQNNGTSTEFVAATGN